MTFQVVFLWCIIGINVITILLGAYNTRKSLRFWKGLNDRATEGILNNMEYEMKLRRREKEMEDRWTSFSPEQD